MSPGNPPSVLRFVNSKGGVDSTNAAAKTTELPSTSGVKRKPVRVAKRTRTSSRQSVAQTPAERSATTNRTTVELGISSKSLRQPLQVDVDPVADDSTPSPLVGARKASGNGLKSLSSILAVPAVTRPDSPNRMLEIEAAAAEGKRLQALPALAALIIGETPRLPGVGIEEGGLGEFQLELETQPAFRPQETPPLLMSDIGGAGKSAGPMEPLMRLKALRGPSRQSGPRPQLGIGSHIAGPGSVKAGSRKAAPRNTVGAKGAAAKGQTRKTNSPSLLAQRDDGAKTRSTQSPAVARITDSLPVPVEPESPKLDVSKPKSAAPQSATAERVEPAPAVAGTAPRIVDSAKDSAVAESPTLRIRDEPTPAAPETPERAALGARIIGPPAAPSRSSNVIVDDREMMLPEAPKLTPAAPLDLAPKRDRTLDGLLDGSADEDKKAAGRANGAVEVIIRDPAAAETVPPADSTVVDAPAPVVVVPAIDGPLDLGPVPGPYRVAEPGVRISRTMRHLQSDVNKVLRFYYDRPLNTGDDSAWSVMHSMLGYGQQTPLAIGKKRGRRTNAVQWMCQNRACAGRPLLYLDARGRVVGHEGPGVQGHPGQFLCMLAQIGLPRDFPLHVNGRQFTVGDLVRSEMQTCRVDQELTFKLIAFSYYLSSDLQWRNDEGELWSIDRMLQIELSQPVNGVACGGTHRLMGISCAVRHRLMRGEPLDGTYVQAQKYVRDYQRYAMSLQNRDGSFSTDWFKRRHDRGDRDRKLQTTGHILEWLVYSLPRHELADPRIVKSVKFLSGLMSRHRYHSWEVGPRGHAIRALSLYQKRVFMPRHNIAKQTLSLPR